MKLSKMWNIVWILIQRRSHVARGMHERLNALIDVWEKAERKAARSDWGINAGESDRT